jgi:hypothetical protein
MQAMTRDHLKALAAANGLTITDERLDLVLREYLSLMQTLQELNTLQLPSEAEPADTFSLVPPALPSGGR